MKRIYNFFENGMNQEFQVETDKETIEITRFNGCAIEEMIDLPRPVFKEIVTLLAKTELLEQIEAIRDKLDEEELARAEIIISQLNSIKTSSRDLARLEAEIDELSTEF